jgi:hypothetical protein
MPVSETGFKYVIEFCSNTVEPFGSVYVMTIFGMAKK